MLTSGTTMQEPTADLHAFRPVPKTGVIYVTSEATKLGFSSNNPEWCNLGQGQPETGELPGAPPRVHNIEIALDDQEYAPVAGLSELREAIAALYNGLYRKGMASQYTAENVCISGGGRAALTRAAVPLLEMDYVTKETLAIQNTFRTKRDTMISRLERMGVRFDRVPDGTFYAWGNVAALPPPLNEGMGLFRAGLTKKIITVPGEFFDVNPGKRRHNRQSRFRDYVRFSFGPGQETLELALARLEELIAGK